MNLTEVPILLTSPVGIENFKINEFEKNGGNHTVCTGAKIFDEVGTRAINDIHLCIIPLLENVANLYTLAAATNSYNKWNSISTNYHFQAFSCYHARFHKALLKEPFERNISFKNGLKSILNNVDQFQSMLIIYNQC